MNFFAQTTIELTQSNDVTTSTDSSAAGVGIGLMLLYLAVVAFLVVCAAKIYTKAGRQWWEAIIPIYNLYVLQQIVGRPGWWVLLYFIPLANVVVAIINGIDLAKAFGRGLGTGLALVFLPIIMYPIMAFSSSYKYQRADSAGNQPDAGPSSDTGTVPGATAPKDDSSESNIAAGGAAAGGAAASSGMAAGQDVSPQSQEVADSSSSQPTTPDIGTQDTDSSQDNVAQADGAPAYPGEEPSVDASPEESTETVEPETDSYQSGSTEETPPTSEENIPISQPEDEGSAGASDEDSNTKPPEGGSDNQSAGGAGPAIG